MIFSAFKLTKRQHLSRCKKSRLIFVYLLPEKGQGHTAQGRSQFEIPSGGPKVQNIFHDKYFEIYAREFVPRSILQSNLS